MKVHLLILSLFLYSCCALYPGYKVSQLNQVAYGYQGSLSLNGPGPYGADISTLALEVYYQTQDILRIKIYDPNNARWEVPDVNQLSPPTTAPSTLDYKISFVNNPFGFTVTRVSNGDVIFDTTSSKFNPLIFEDQYLELTTTLPNNPNIYGLGERITNFRLPVGVNYTIWNIDQGTPTVKNLYGTHPFYLEMRETGLAHGVFALNSNAQDWELQANSLTYKTIGGIFDIFIFVGPTPANVVQQYHTVIGTPHFPPYWGLGWHQCRWGYNNLSETQAVVANYAKYGIPLDTMWNDIDYMDLYRDFTNDPNRFPQSEVRQFVQDLHANGQHYIMIIDPGINIAPGYAAYDQLLESKAYVKISGSDAPIPGKVWPGPVYFPDFFHPNATDYWFNQVSAFHASGPEFDGMWIDMNEVSNFCNGQCGTEDNKQARATPQGYDNPPFLPGDKALDTDTINVTAQQYVSISYNTHSMYGWSEGIASKLALEKLRGTRSIVISRSTFAGSGHHNGHWLGDNNSNFEDLYNSIAGVLSMQLYGVNLVGADICGFGGNTTPELCARWMQLGSLYPFARNHNSIGSVSQEPYAFGEPLISISIAALKTRYTLLPYYYTLFASAHFNATTVWRPLFFEFPTDLNTFGIDQQFLIGSSLLVSPVLTQGATNVSAYFPEGVWYNYYDGTPLVGTGSYVTLDAPLTVIPIHVRGGEIVPTQTPANTTTVARTLPYGLLVALDKSGNAEGYIYIDDGESLDPITSYSIITYTATSNSVTSQIINNSYNTNVPGLGWIVIYGVQSGPSKVVLNGQAVDFSYNNQVLEVNAGGADMLTSFTLTWA